MIHGPRGFSGHGCRPELWAALGVLCALGGLARLALPAAGYEIAVVEGVSMAPTFRTGDVLLVRHATDFHRGEVVLFETEAAGRCIKRITAMGGDQGARIPGRGWSSALYLRGRSYYDPRFSVRPVRLIGEEIFVEGDNVPMSTDSRNFGPVPRHCVSGKVVGHVDAPVSAGLTGLGLLGLWRRKKRTRADVIGG